jgi:hypothetical protein
MILTNLVTPKAATMVELFATNGPRLIYTMEKSSRRPVCILRARPVHLVIDIKSFITLTPCVNVIKLFSFIADDEAK